MSKGLGLGQQPPPNITRRGLCESLAAAGASGTMNVMRAVTDTEWIIGEARELGFDLCGITSVESLFDAGHLKEWLDRGYAGQMRYMHDPRRADINQVLPQAKTAIVCAINYNTDYPASTEAVAQAATGSGHGWISRYAWGGDYHSILGKRLEQLIASMRAYFAGEWQARAYVDTGPVSERVIAAKAGLGWQAKNTCLINEEFGSWLFLGLILTSLELRPSNGIYSTPADLCGNCTLCLDACPTGALVEPYVMDARRCIAYLTIELREAIPDELRSSVGWHVFGCDICQDVCPWNRKAAVSSNSAFQPRENLVAPELTWLLSLSEDEFREVFSGSPVKRAKWSGMIRNACIAAGNVAGQYARGVPEQVRLRQRLRELAESSDPLIAEHAAWALSRID
jgi:epoxyqueuosine reductase